MGTNEWLDIKISFITLNLKEYIVIIGGFENTTSESNKIYVYDTMKHKWLELDWGN